MPEDEMTDDVQTEDEESGGRLSRRQIRELEANAKAGRESAARLAEVERELAFAQALGTAVTEPKMSYFVRGYDGELDAEAIRKAAIDAGFLSTSPSSPGPSAYPDLASYERLSSASEGALPPPPFDAIAEINKVDWRDPNAQEKVLDICERAGRVTNRNADRFAGDAGGGFE